MSEVSFEVTREESKLIKQIADRATRMWPSIGKKSLRMDITAVHANGCRLRLKDLLNADDFNFGHDVLGIMRHIDRTSGDLKHCFLPRYSVPEREVA